MFKLLVVATLLGEYLGTANYIGCFQDTTYEFVANSTFTDDPSVKKCIQFCLSESYKFASHQNHRGCYCGESFSQGSLPEGRCYAYCPGALAEDCVGQYTRTLWYIPQPKVAESTSWKDSDDAASGESKFENTPDSSLPKTSPSWKAQRKSRSCIPLIKWRKKWIQSASGCARFHMEIQCRGWHEMGYKKGLDDNYNDLFTLENGFDTK